MVVVLGQDEARRFKHNYIGTEHLLLGLLREEEGVGGRALESLEVTLEDVRAQVARIIGSGDEVKIGQIPFTPRAKKVLELALRESVSLGHNHIGTEHILLGIVRENEGVASRILLDLGADAEKVRNEVVRSLSGHVRFPPRQTPVPPHLVDLPPHMQAEIMRVRTKKERAIERQSFDRAARLREREGRLVELARAGDHEGFWEYAGRTAPDEPPPAAAPPVIVAPAPAATWSVRAVAAGWALFGVALGLGVLIGRLVWG